MASDPAYRVMLERAKSEATWFKRERRHTQIALELADQQLAQLRMKMNEVKQTSTLQMQKDLRTLRLNQLRALGRFPLSVQTLDLTEWANPRVVVRSFFLCVRWSTISSFRIATWLAFLF